MDISRDERICIVGAGAAGLSAATYLRDSGFRGVTVLEREDEVGGKCRSVVLDGASFELGAVIATTDYKETLGLMKRVGIDPWKRPRPTAKDLSFVDRGLYPNRALFPGWFALRELPLALRDIARYHLLAPRWPEAFAPGHAGVPEELAGPFSAWVSRYGMEELAKLYSIPFTAFGYGYYDEVPAAYVLKFFDPGITRSFLLQGKFFYWKEGVQEVWRRLAAPLDLRTGAEIGRVRRRPAGGGGAGRSAIEVAWTERRTGASRVETFDRLILACPYDDAIAFLDADEEEKDLASRIAYYDYRVRVARVPGLRVPAGFAPARFSRAGQDRPMLWDEPSRGAGISTFYTLAGPSTGDAEILSNIAADVRLMGGEVAEVLAQANWKYFPHVSAADYRGGFYGRLEARQGARGTYIAGEVATFSCVERTVRYSRDLVGRHFAPGPA